MQKKILYISYDGMTDQLGQSQVLPYLCELKKYGFEFHLISCEKPEKFKQHKELIEAICEKNGIRWYPLPYTKRPPVYSTIKDVRNIRRLAFRLQKQHHFDMVHCRGYIPALVGLQLKKKAGVRFLFDMRGLWANEKVDAGSWNLRNPVYRSVYNYFKKKERQFFENADYTISLTHAAQKEIASWKYIADNPVKMEVIPCCADLGLFDPLHVADELVATIRKETGIHNGEPVLSYLGSIGSWYMLDEMLDFFNVYCRKYPSARFFFISGDQHDLIRKKAAEKNIAAEKIIIRPATRKEVPASISLSTHSVFFIRPTYSKISSSPTKQAELMGMGIPVISNAGVGDSSAIIEKYKSGIVINDFSEAAYGEAMERLQNFSEDRESIREGALHYFSLDEGVKKYLQVYRQILGD
ncbi:MAG TPA: glycosyltransferase [Chitinophagaceae bacterium]|nr:glycosyltransferase [Chitinophagaceae bacterium]